MTAGQIVQRLLGRPEGAIEVLAIEQHMKAVIARDDQKRPDPRFARPAHRTPRPRLPAGAV